MLYTGYKSVLYNYIKPMRLISNQQLPAMHHSTFSSTRQKISPNRQQKKTLTAHFVLCTKSSQQQRKKNFSPACGGHVFYGTALWWAGGNARNKSRSPSAGHLKSFRGEETSSDILHL